MCDRTGTDGDSTGKRDAGPSQHAQHLLNSGVTHVVNCRFFLLKLFSKLVTQLFTEISDEMVKLLLEHRSNLCGVFPEVS